MCTVWSRVLLALGILGGFFNRWLVIVAAVPIVSVFLTRVLHRAIWPAALACPAPGSRSEKTDMERRSR